MDTTTEDVTLLTQYVKDVITVVEELDYDIAPLNNLLKNVDLSNPYAHIPIDHYNNVCEYVEKMYGNEAIIKVGYQIGRTVYDMFVENNMIWGDPSPQDLINNLEIAAESTINDPKERGWLRLESMKESLLMRKTQTFNSKLQFGLLKGLMEMSPLIQEGSVSVSYQNEISKGAEYDEYLITWSLKDIN